MEGQAQEKGKQMSLADINVVSNEKMNISYDDLNQMQTQIEAAEVTTSNTGYVDVKDPATGKMVSKFVVNSDTLFYQLQVKSKALKTVKLGDGTDVEVRAMEWFNLYLDKNGKPTVNTKGKSNLAKFMKTLRATTPAEMIGKNCIVKVVDKPNSDGTARQVCRFMY